MSAGLIVIGVLTLLIWIFGYIPFICVNLLRFYNFRFDMTLSKRYPSITLITVTALVLWQLIFILEIIRFFFGGSSSFQLAFDFLNIICSFTFSSSILWRFYLSYYDIQFSISTSSREWQKFIDTDAQFNNWYFKNRKKYGDYNWTRTRFIIGNISLIIIYILLALVPFLAILRFIVLIIPWILMIIIYCKTPSFYDSFGIRKEIRRILILYSSVLIGYLALAIIVFILTHSTSISEIIQSIIYTIAIHFISFIVFGIGWTMTYWVLKIVDVGFDDDGNPIKAPLNPWGHQRRHHPGKPSTTFQSSTLTNEFGGGGGIASGAVTNQSVEPSDQGYSMTNSDNIKSSKMGSQERKKYISLSTMFTNINYINELFRHLSKEFSMECLLSLIEFYQLQQYILLHMHQHKNYYYRQFDKINIKNNVSMPSGVPRSTIIYGDNEAEVEKYLFNQGGRIISIHEREQVRVRLISYQLYHRYVATSSEWEINISYDTRGKLTAKLHNFNAWMSASNKKIQMWELLQLFESPKQEMYRLLRFSFARFKRSNDNFAKIQNHFEKVLKQKEEEEAKIKAQKEKKLKKIAQSDKYQKLDDDDEKKDYNDNDNDNDQIVPADFEDEPEPDFIDGIDIINDERRDTDM